MQPIETLNYINKSQNENKFFKMKLLAMFCFAASVMGGSDASLRGKESRRDVGKTIVTMAENDYIEANSFEVGTENIPLKMVKTASKQAPVTANDFAKEKVKMDEKVEEKHNDKAEDGQRRRLGVDAQCTQYQGEIYCLWEEAPLGGLTTILYGYSKGDTMVYDAPYCTIVDSANPDSACRSCTPCGNGYTNFDCSNIVSGKCAKGDCNGNCVN